ncbi:MAG TPA: indole-3-glycerol phosphate synthase TrpC, partial [Thermomicrobiales bacterium]|nr:indole-3-glycerol phosphate synthase TrpC [Thermomicrobiales bacterium]
NALGSSGIGVIAEIKRASPSKGVIAENIVAAEVARDYLNGGCAAISVLTDETFFGGSLDDLHQVAALAHAQPSPVPVLRKDFVIDEYQIYEARAAGADAVLLIVAALSDDELFRLQRTATNFGVDTLVEVHNEEELRRALRINPPVVGINNRDLRTFEVDLATTERLAPLIPDGVIVVGESGIRTRDDVERLAAAGVDAVLVGETLMRQVDRAAAIGELLG